MTTISRYLLKFQDRQEGGRRLDRLAVCAPTNKAIVVLAERFIRAIASSSINAVVIGDAQKLLGINKRHSPLLPFFAYSFQEEIGKKLDDVKKWCISSNRPSDAWDKIICLKNHICRSLKGLHGEFKAKLESLCALFQSSNVGYEKLYKLTNDIYKEFTELPADVVLMDLLDSADVIFCTLCSSGCTVMKKTKSVGALIVDEAAAATEPEICIPFHLNPTRLLIVGDPKQLPATVLSERASKYGLSVSLHERLMYDCKMKYVMLDTQYRMNPEISSFASLRFYQGKISNAANVTSASYQKRGMLLDGRPYLFLETGGTEAKAFGGSCINTKEAVTILNLAKVLRDSNDSQWASPDSLRIITFYAAQVNLIRRMLDDNLMKDVVVSTVDSTQGCEADIVILSLVRTDVAGFLTDDRRLNVALTRARKQLICVGSVSTFSEMKDAPTLQLLASDAMTRNVIVPNRKVTVGSDVSCKRSSFVTQSEEEGEV